MTEADTVDDAPLARQRAQPMTPDDRRAMIAEQAIPLFIEFGSSLTTRQLAEHLGIAEGTIFRAFGDKDALVRRRSVPSSTAPRRSCRPGSSTRRFPSR